MLTFKLCYQLLNQMQKFVLPDFSFNGHVFAQYMVVVGKEVFLCSVIETLGVVVPQYLSLTGKV